MKILEKAIINLAVIVITISKICLVYHWVDVWT